MELEAVLALTRTDLKDEWLIEVSEEGDGSFCFEILASLADSPAGRGKTAGLVGRFGGLPCN